MDTGDLWDRLTLGRARRRRRIRRLMRRNDPWTTRPRRREAWRSFFVRSTTTVVAVVATLVFLNQRDVVVTLDRLVGSGQASGPGYAFLAHQDGRTAEPVTYSPCRPIHVVVNDSDAPDGAYDLTVSAVRAIADATGLSLVVDGRTGESPSGDRTIGSAPDWAPVLIAWTTPEGEPKLDGSVVGIGGSSSLRDPLSGYRYYVTGRVALDTPGLERMADRAGTDAVRGVIMHELGHVVGLGHVEDRSELMYRSSRGDELGPGDRRGLARLGAGKCYG